MGKFCLEFLTLYLNTLCMQFFDMESCPFLAQLSMTARASGPLSYLMPARTVSGRLSCEDRDLGNRAEYYSI